MANEPIDELSVLLSVDAEGFAAEINEQIESAKTSLTDFEQQIRELSKALGDLGTGGEWAITARMGGIDIEEYLKQMQEEGAYTKEEFTALAQEAREVDAILEEISQKTLDYMTAMAEAAGLVVPPEMLEKLNQVTDALSVNAENADQYLADIEAISDEWIQAVKIFTPVQESVNRINDAFQKQGKVVPIQKIDDYRAKLEKLVKAEIEAGSSAEKINRVIAQEEQAFLKANGALGEQNELIGWLKDGWKSLTGALTGALAVMAILQKVWAFIKESIEVAEKGAKINHELAISVRAYQRATGALAPTQERALEFANELSRAYAMTNEEAKNLVAQTLNVTRQLRLTENEMEDVARAAATYGKAMGENVMSVLDTFVEFLQTGRPSEALRDLGFDFDEARLYSEGLKRGLIELGDELDDETAAMIGWAMILEESAELEKDLTELTDNYTDRMAALNEQSRTAKENFGTMLLPLKEMVTYLTTNALDAFVIFAQTVGIAAVTAMDFFAASMGGIMAGAEYLVDSWNNKVIPDLKTFQKEVHRGWSEAWEGWDERISEYVFGTETLADETKTNLDEAGDAWEEFSGKIGQAVGEASADIEQLRIDIENKISEIERDLATKLNDISRQFARRRADAYRDYIQDMEDIDRDAAEDRARTQIEYQEDTERRLADHLLRKKRMEEDYLWELDDAVRERDARRVLQLQRQFNRDKRRADEDFDIESARRKQAFEEEMAEIELQRLRRRAERQRAFEEQMADLARQEAERKADARRRAAERIAEIRRQAAAELRELAARWAEKLKLDHRGFTLLLQMFDRIYGGGGAIEQYLQRYIAMMQAFARATQLMAAGRRAIENAFDIIRSMGGGYAPRSRQRGGSFVATSPQMISVAESSPEMVSVTPLSQATGQPRAGFGGVGGKIGLDVNISLDEGLIAKVTERAMDEVADVVVNVSRGGNRRGIQ